METSFKFSIADLFLLVTAVAIYIPFFMWGIYPAQSLMLGGGMVLFVGKVSQVVMLQFGAFQLYKTTTRHEKLWLALAVIGIVSIIFRPMLAML